MRHESDLFEDLKLSTNRSYKKAFLILMEYWESLPDEEKSNIDKELKNVGC